MNEPREICGIPYLLSIVNVQSLTLIFEQRPRVAEGRKGTRCFGQLTEQYFPVNAIELSKKKRGKQGT